MRAVQLLFALLLIHGAAFAEQDIAIPMTLAATSTAVSQTMASGVSVGEVPTREWYRYAVLVFGIGAVSVAFGQAFMAGKKKI